MLTAIRRASSFVSNFPCRASASLSASRCARAPRWHPGQHSRRVKEPEGGGMSFGTRRARRPVEVWLPPHWRDLQWRSLPRSWLGAGGRVAAVRRSRTPSSAHPSQAAPATARRSPRSASPRRPLAPWLAALRLRFPVQRGRRGLGRWRPGHRWAIWVLDLDPISRRSRAVRRARAFRHAAPAPNAQGR
jgi:hypothetical protein